MSRFSTVVAFVVLTAAVSVGQDAVEFKTHYPKVGDRVKVTIEEKGDSKTTISVMGQVQNKNEAKTKSLVYVDEALAVDAGVKKPTKLSRSYDKAVTSTDGKETKLGIEGKTVLIEKKGDKYTFSVDGKPVDAESLKLLEAEFTKKDKDDSDFFLPKKALKPGETWKIDSEKLVAEFGKDMKLDAAKTAAEGRLVRTFKRDGAQFGEIAVTITAPILDLGGKGDLKLKDSGIAFTLSGEGVIDGTSPKGKSKIVGKFVIAGTGEGFEVKVEGTTTETRTTEPLPKALPKK